MNLKYILWLGRALEGLERAVKKRNMTQVCIWAGEIEAIANEDLKGNISGWRRIEGKADWLKGVGKSVTAEEGIYETTEEAWTQWKEDQENLVNLIEETIGEIEL